MPTSLVCQGPDQKTHGACVRPSCECVCHWSRNRMLLPDEQRRLPPGAMLPPAGPRRSRKKHRKDAVYDDEGRRLCPRCLLPFVRKPGPGRYPEMHAECREQA
jgi:hypothetical protein